MENFFADTQNNEHTMILKCFLIVISLTLAVSCSTSQYYSTKNKKAIKLFEQGKVAPAQSIDQQTRTPNYKEGIRLMERAIKKAPNFWEAHMFAGEMSELIHDYPAAIYHFKKALSLNPKPSSTGSTYFYLANLQLAVGDYDAAINNIDLFQTFRNANPKLLKNAQQIRANCVFAKHAMENPSSFNPINIGPGINTKDPEYFPTITVDGKTILFTRQITDSRVNTPSKTQEDFFISHLTSDTIWQTAIAMPSNVNTVNNEGAPSISADGRSLVFVACPDITGGNYGTDRNGQGSCDLFYSKKLGNTWTNPINLPGKVNTPAWESQPSLSADGKTMYFIRRVSRRGEPRNSDIFVTHLDHNGKWGVAKRLPSYINTPGLEESVLIHPDGKTLYFASRGHIGMGGLDLFLCRLNNDGTWSKPENLGYPINTKYDENSLMVSPNGEIAFFASDREGGFGNLDIYYFTMPESLRPTKTLYFEGLVYNINTRKPIPGKFELIDIATGELVIVSEADRLTGEFIVSLPTNREYALNVSYPGYTFFSKNVNMKSPENLDAIHMDMPMIPIEKSNSEPIILANIFFDLAQSTLREESYVELTKLLEFLKENASIKIEIGGHTDSRGDGTKNKILSENRAKSVEEYLISKGIDRNRLTSKGYASTKPIYTDAQIKAMSSGQEKAHQSNRRTEYKIIK